MTEPRRGLLPLALALGIVAAIQVLVLWRLAAPAALKADAAQDRFSAERALQFLRRILGDEAPHPVGTVANAEVRRRVVEELTRLGYEPEIHESFAIGRHGIGAPVVNVTARLPGRVSGAVMVSTHYDSVPAGPGASDDGAGVAALLEIARLLRDDHLPRPVLFFIGDGEEAGLLGARAFVAEDRHAEVAAVVNLEARGTSGPVALFETSDGNDDIVGIVTRRMPRPVTSSTLYRLYKLLPNDTDLTVYKRHGMAGINLAFADGLHDYHTPNDRIDRLDPRSLQHMGEAALHAIRALGMHEGAIRRDRDACFFDLLGLVVLRWPAWWNRVLSILAAALIGIASYRTLRGQERPWRRMAWGFGGFIGTLALPSLSGLFLCFVLRWLRGVDQPWRAHPHPMLVALWALTLGVSLWMATLTGRRAHRSGAWAGPAICWAFLTVIAGLAAPEVSHLFLLPAAAAGLGSLWDRIVRTRAPRAQVFLPLGAACILWLPLVHALTIMVGIDRSVLITLPLSILLTWVAPLVPSCARIRALVIVSLAIATVAAVRAMVVPAYSVERPQHLNVRFWQDADSGAARLVLRPSKMSAVPAAMRRGGQLRMERLALFPWTEPSEYAMTATASALGVQPPEATVTAQEALGDGRRIAVRLRSPRGAYAIYLCIPESAGVLSVRIEGRAVEPNAASTLKRHPGWHVYGCVGLQPDGVDLDLQIATSGPVDAVLADLSHGLPPEGVALARHRPPSAVPVQEGDVTYVRRRIRL